MLDGLVGASQTRTINLAVAGVPLTGATVTYTLTDPTGDEVISAQAATDLGSGDYGYAVDGSEVAYSGLYRELWTITSGSNEYPQEGWFLLGEWEPGLVPRWALRHRIATRLRDNTLGVFTTSSTTAPADTSRWEPDDHWNGAEQYVYAGTGRAQSRRLTDFANTGGVFTPALAYSTAPAVGDRYELHTRWTVEEYNLALATAVDEVRSYVLWPITHVGTVVDTEQYEYDLPAPFQTLREVWTLPEPAPDTAPDLWTKLDGGTWGLRPGRKLWLGGPLSEVTLRLVGETAWGELNTDDALARGPLQFLEFRAAANLLGSRLQAAPNDAQGYLAQLQYMESRAEMLHPKNKKRARPNARRVS